MERTPNTTGEWKPESTSEQFLQQVLANAYGHCPEAKLFAIRMKERLAVRVRDLLDHITFNDAALIPRLKSSGWIGESNDTVFRNPLGVFPPFVADPGNQRVFFKVEFVRDFIKANNINAVIDGQEGSQFRSALVFNGAGVDFHAIERHGTADFKSKELPDHIIKSGRIHQQIFRSRRRSFDDINQGFDYLEASVNIAVSEIGQDWACELFLRAEREYWMMRNTAGRIQKERQDKMGIGWANQDHHTFDSSREHFYRTILVLEKLGFECRELFYAGAGAGWGSQILEQPVLNSVIFADIDLAPHELDIDFAHDRNIKPLYPLRRAGLWCAMHGESIFEAGLNHLECMYDSNRCNELFKQLDIPMMEPFSDFPHLYQALTVGEWWPVDPAKIDRLEREGHLDSTAASNFKQFGAIGSHFENLERNDGFKGFNQPGIDDVLRIIDPRKQLTKV